MKSYAEKFIKKIKSASDETLTEIIDKIYEEGFEDGSNEEEKKFDEKLWYDICNGIEKWTKLTKRDFIKDYENVRRGN